MPRTTNLSLSFGSFLGYYDASLGQVPSGSFNKGDYWIINNPGIILGIGSFSVGDVLIRNASSTPGPSSFFKINTNLPTNSYILDIVGSSSTALSLRKLKSSYNGPLLRVVNYLNQEIDIGFNSFGYIDESILLPFLNSNPGYVKIWYSQEQVYNAIQNDFSKMPFIQKIDGVWSISFVNGRFLEISSFIGNQTNSTVDVIWKCPVDSLGIFTQQSAIDFNDNDFLSPWWTTNQGPFFYKNGVSFNSQSQYSDQSFRQHIFKFLNNNFSVFEYSNPINDTTLINNPNYQRVRIGKNVFQSGNIYISELIIWNKDVNENILFTDYKQSYENLNTQLPKLYVNSGDSISTTVFTNLGKNWSNYTFRQLNYRPNFSMVNSGWTVVDIYNRKERINWYKQNIDHFESVYILFAGTNDLFFGASALDTYNNIRYLTDYVKSIGFDKVLIITPLPRTALGFESKRQDLTNLLVSNVGTYQILDTRLIPGIGSDGDQNNTFCYADTTHLNAVGSELLSSYIVNALQTL